MEGNEDEGARAEEIAGRDMRASSDPQHRSRRANGPDIEASQPSSPAADPSPPNGPTPGTAQLEPNRVSPPHRNQHAPNPGTGPSRPETFWTSCDGCGTRYEYHIIYLNENLLCARCELPFWARPSSPRQQQDVPAASSGSTAAPPSATRPSQGAP